MAGRPDPRQTTPEFRGVGFWPTGETINGRTVWCVVGGPLAYSSHRIGPVLIPEGFTFDGPSIPWAVSWAMPSGAMFLGSAVHDFLLTRTRHPKPLCDLVFLDALRDCRCPEWAATLAYRAVRTQRGRI